MYNELCTKSYQEAEMMPKVEQLCKFTTWFKAQIYSRQSQTWCGPTLLQLVRSDVFGPSTKKVCSLDVLVERLEKTNQKLKIPR